MPQWGKLLTEEQRWYLVAFLKTLPREVEVYPKGYESLDVEKIIIPNERRITNAGNV